MDDDDDDDDDYGDYENQNVFFYTKKIFQKKRKTITGLKAAQKLISCMYSCIRLGKLF